ncbi:polyamine aminopropyltransferase [Fodinicurvata sediminis]|uniref:polyamine aminopropyltransferase n=1 Tax=Fodinicurvata sediminis TaxID=1121832 RepID=UPI0003B2F6C5|nr:polyamine aminopropyltransferase [Fodinicurvata sediminis]
MKQVYQEALHQDYGQFFTIAHELYREKTEHQDLVIFENAAFGKVLALDGIIQTTTGDNHIYHEMLVHVPLLAHGNARNILIIGGGDGGTLREAVKHPLDKATMVEIDSHVIELSKEYLPELSDGAFDHPRAEVIVGDGYAFVEQTDRRFDVIIVDSSDPVGPSAVLFSEAFYRNCRRCLNPGGILITQNGVPYLQSDELTNGHRILSKLFEDMTFYLATVPTYSGGPMAFGWASNAPEHRNTPVEILRERYSDQALQTSYYTPDIHKGAFALPPRVSRLMKD